jgi:hypothetical protein
LLAGPRHIDAGSGIVLLTSRVSVEMVQKAAILGAAFSGGRVGADGTCGPRRRSVRDDTHRDRAGSGFRVLQSPAADRGLGAQIVNRNSTRSTGGVMNRLKVTTIIAGASLFLGTLSAYAVPCGTQIAHFEDFVRHSEKNPESGPTAPQSVGAQLGHQPTPSSVMQAEEQAQTGFEATLARAKTLDAQGRDAECMQALRDAKLLFNGQ